MLYNKTIIGLLALIIPTVDVRTLLQYNMVLLQWKSVG